MPGAWSLELKKSISLFDRSDVLIFPCLWCFAMCAIFLMPVLVVGGFLPMGQVFGNLPASPASHAALPVGTVGRLANVESGPMPGSGINERMRDDGRLIAVSHASEGAIEVRSGGPAPTVVLPPASTRAPYRVQFGAFRRVSSAEKLSSLLDGAGIPTSIFTAPGSGLVVVVTDGGFPTAEEAQSWIDFEGARRGWTERPVVIR